DYKMYPVPNGEPVECRSILDTTTQRIAPAATPEIVGRDKVCENQEEIRYVTKYNEGSNYFWTISGNKIAYVKDDFTPNVRYVDWDVPGYDTLTVIVVTDAYCIGYDTLVVKTAPYPVPSFTWTLPGASNVV